MAVSLKTVVNNCSHRKIAAEGASDDYELVKKGSRNKAFGYDVYGLFW